MSKKYFPGAIPDLLAASALILAAATANARPLFENSNFEHGTLENWEAENWCIATPELFGDTKARFQKNGMYAAISLKDRGERVVALYESDGKDKLLRTLKSKPFTVSERFLQFQISLTPFPKEKPKFEIGIDANLDGKIDLKLNSSAIHPSLCFLDLKEYQGKQVRFIARITGASCVVDNFLLLPEITPEFIEGREFTAGNTLEYNCTLRNRSAAQAGGFLEISVKDYFNKVVFSEKRNVSVPGNSRKKETFRWRLSSGKKYRMNVLVRAADGTVVEQVTKTLYPTHFSDGRDWMMIPESGWQRTLSGDKNLEMPLENAIWDKESPFPGSDSYYWRNGKWKPSEKTAQQWFRREIEVPATFFRANRRLILSFDAGGGGLTNLFINGKAIGKDWHLYPYVRKELDVSAFMKPGKNLFIFRMRNPMFYTPGDMKKRLFEYPVFVHNRTPMSGILGKLYLESREAVSVTNCYIDSWMNPEKVDLRVNIVNRSAKAATAKIQSRIIDSSDRVLAVLPEISERIPAHGTHQVKTSGTVKNLPRWTPDTPNLLQMEIRCITSEGTDIFRERFGFHEYSYRGREFLLNGHPVSILETLMQHHGLAADWKKWWGANAIRRANCPEQLDAGDEEGFFQRMVQEDIYPGTVMPNPPLLPESYIQPFTDLEMGQVDYFYNHPSFYMWNLGNELDGHGYFRAQTRSYYEKLFGGITEKIYALDPQRSVAGSGDAIADFFRRKAWSVHYPYEYSIAHDLPNSGKLLTEKHPLHVLAPNMPWDGKPVFCGENFSESGVGPYLAAFGGDMPDTMANWFAVWRDFFRIRSRSMRMDGISAIAPFTPIITLRHYYPIELFVTDYKEQYFAGTEMSLPVTVMHDNFRKEKLALAWSIGEKAGTEIFDFAPGERKNVKLPAIPLPETETVLPIRLELLRDGKPLTPKAVWNGKVSVIRKYNANGKTAGVLHGDKKAADLLKFYGFNVQTVNPLRIPDHITFLLCSSGTLPGDRKNLEQWTAKGNTLLVLLEKPGVCRIANQDIQVRSHKDTHTFNIASFDPLTSGLDNTLLRYWRSTDSRVMENAIVRPDSADCRTLFLCGDSSGLRFASLLEEKNQKGRILYTTLLMTDCGKDIPAAGVLLRNASMPMGKRAIPKTAVLVRDSWQQLLQANNVSVTDLAAANDPADTVMNSSIVVIDGESQADEDSLLKFVEQGGTLVLWRMTPETLAKFGKLIGSGVTLRRVPDDNSNALVGIKAGTPLLNSISNGDLSWRRGRIMFVAGGRDMRTTITAISDYWYEFAGNDWKALTEPIALAVRKHGKGRIILDQIRWDNAGADAPEALRTALTWYENLGIKRSSSPEAKAAFDRIPIKLPGNWKGEANSMEIANAKNYFSRNPAAVILGSEMEFTKNPKKITLNLNNRTFERLVLNTASAFGYIDYSMNKVYADIQINYADGDSETIRLKYGDHGDDIRVRSAAPLGSAKQIAAMEADGVSIYQTVWRNPKKDQPVESIRISSVDEKIVPILFSVILETRQKGNETLKRKRSGEWSIPARIRDTGLEGVRIWAVGGPFENNWTGNVENKPRAFDQKFAPEYGVDLSKLLRVAHGLTSWKKYSEKFNSAAPQIIMAMNPENVLEFKNTPRDKYCAYFYTKVYSPEKQKVLVAFGSDDAGKIWLNGKLIHSHWVLRGSWLGDDIVETTLEKGWNTVLIKLIQMRLGVGVAFDIKPWFENWKAVPGHTIGAKPSLNLKYDAYAANNIKIPAALTLKECSSTKIMPGVFSNSGIFAQKDADGSDSILFDYSYAGNQSLTVPYQQFMQHGKFKNGIFSMEFKIPSEDVPKGKIHLAGRNAGGRHTGDLQIHLDPDVHGAPGDRLTLWWETGPAADDIRKLVLPLKRIFPKGLPFDRYLKLNISWGDSGFKVEMDGKILMEEKNNHTPCFTSPVHFSFGHSTMPEGKLYIRKISLEEQEQGVK